MKLRGMLAGVSEGRYVPPAPQRAAWYGCAPARGLCLGAEVGGALCRAGALLLSRLPGAGASVWTGP